MNKNEIWKQVLELIENELSDMSYETWFLPLVPVIYENDIFVLEADLPFIKNHIEKNYITLLQNALKHVTGKLTSVKIIIKGTDTEGLTLKKEEPKSAETPLRNANGLTTKYRFDNFVVGSSNQLAHSAAVAVSEMPGKEYNPLFLYGGVGLGKTHLMNAIGNEALENDPNLKIAYVASVTFMNELIDSIRTNKNTEFRSKYRDLDFLLIDDIQFISNKVQTQEEFFHTFNELQMNGSQIVISSDRPPAEIEHLTDRLVSRFQAGLVVDLRLPDFETRTAILQQKARAMNYAIPDDVIKYISENIRSNIRELEGVLNRVVLYQKIYPGEVTIEMAELAIADIIKMNKPKVTIDYIQEVVANTFGFSPEDLKSKQKHKPLAIARQTAMYLCRKMLSENYKEIGRKFGNKDHTTVLSACKKIGSMIENDEEFRTKVLNLEKKISD